MVAVAGIYGPPLKPAVVVSTHVPEPRTVAADWHSGKPLAVPFFSELEDTSLGWSYRWSAAVDGGPLPDKAYLYDKPSQFIDPESRLIVLQ